MSPYVDCMRNGNFPGKTKNNRGTVLENRKTAMNKTTQICLKYSLRCVRASILERYLKNNRLSPKTMLEYAWNIACREYFSFINFDDICQKHLKLA